MGGNSRLEPISRTRFTTIPVSSSSVEGEGSTTTLNLRLSADERSFTPLSRLFAVAMMLKPRLASIDSFSSGIGRIFSDRIVIRSEERRVGKEGRSRWLQNN